MPNPGYIIVGSVVVALSVGTLAKKLIYDPYIAIHFEAWLEQLLAERRAERQLGGAPVPVGWNTGQQQRRRSEVEMEEASMMMADTESIWDDTWGVSSGVRVRRRPPPSEFDEPAERTINSAPSSQVIFDFSTATSSNAPPLSPPLPPSRPFSPIAYNPLHRSDSASSWDALSRAMSPTPALSRTISPSPQPVSHFPAPPTSVHRSVSVASSRTSVASSSMEDMSLLMPPISSQSGSTLTLTTDPTNVSRPISPITLSHRSVSPIPPPAIMNDEWDRLSSVAGGSFAGDSEFGGESWDGGSERDWNDVDSTR